MSYDLKSIVKSAKRRRVRPIKIRSHTLLQERKLAAIFMRVVDFWAREARNLSSVKLHDAAPFAASAPIPEPEPISIAAQAANVLLEELARQIIDWATESGSWVTLNWVQRVRAETGVDLTLLAGNQVGQQQARTAVEWAISLLRDLSEDTRRKLVNAMYDATLRGATQAESQQIVSGIMKVSAQRAKLIAHDQTQKIVAKLNELQQLEAGVTKYVWNHSFEPNPRRHHVERQGNIYSWSRPPRDGHPGQAINCRCTASAVLEA